MAQKGRMHTLNIKMSPQASHADCMFFLSIACYPEPHNFEHLLYFYVALTVAVTIEIGFLEVTELLSLNSPGL